MLVSRIDNGIVISPPDELPGTAFSNQENVYIHNLPALPDPDLNALGYARAVIPDYDERFQTIWNGMPESIAPRPELIEGKAVFVAAWVRLAQAQSVAYGLADGQREVLEYQSAMVNTPSHGTLPISMSLASKSKIQEMKRLFENNPNHEPIENFQCQDGRFFTMQNEDISAIYAAGVTQTQAAFAWARQAFAAIASAETTEEIKMMMDGL